MSDALPNTSPRRVPSAATPPRRRPNPTVLELVNETVDQDLDLDELHRALAALLVSYHRKQRAEGVSR